jgi:hypothetical protein
MIAATLAWRSLSARLTITLENKRLAAAVESLSAFADANGDDLADPIDFKQA